MNVLVNMQKTWDAMGIAMLTQSCAPPDGRMNKTREFPCLFEFVGGGEVDRFGVCFTEKSMASD